MDTCGAKMFFPGITDPATLDMAAKVCGQVSLKQRGLTGEDYYSQFDVMDPAMARELPKWRALLIPAGLSPVILKCPPAGGGAPAPRAPAPPHQTPPPPAPPRRARAPPAPPPGGAPPRRAGSGAGRRRRQRLPVEPLMTEPAGLDAALAQGTRNAERIASL